MKLATIQNGRRDGQLAVVSRDLKRAVSAVEIVPTLQAALDQWSSIAPQLHDLADALAREQVAGIFTLEMKHLLSPLPRAYAWIDGSAYINHIKLVRQARGAEPPATLETDPLVYQGGSDSFLAPHAAIPLANEAWGCDFESEIACITDDVSQGTSAADAEKHIKLIALCNDVSLRTLIPNELAKGFGFFVSKPSSAFSPVAVTPDELGEHWRDGRVHLPLRTQLNGQLFGQPDAGPEMHFSFHQLIEHITQSRALSAGTLVGSGTVSNRDRSKGSSCLAEARMLEKIDTGSMVTEFLRFGDRVQIEMLDPQGASVFGCIDQSVVSMPSTS